MTTAKKLYAFHEKDVSNYLRWFKKNILNNEFTEEGVDYFPFVTKDECGGQASQDAKLTAGFVKKLSMMQKNEKGEAARNYFAGVENGAKKLFKQISNFKKIAEQFGIWLTDDFVKAPAYEQMHLLLE